MTIDLALNGTIVALSGSVATGLTLQGNEQLLVYGGGEADNTAVYTGGESTLYIFNGATAQNTTLFGGTEDISATGLAVNTEAYSGLQMVSGIAVGATIISGAEQYLDWDFRGSAIDTVLKDGGFQEDFGTASNTTIFDGGVQWVQTIGSATATTIDAGGVQVAWGTVSDSVIDAGGLLVVLPGASVTGSTIMAGGSSVSSGIAIFGGTLPFYTESFGSSLSIAGDTSYIMQGGTAAGFTFSGGNAEVFAGGTLIGSVVKDHAQVVIASGGTAFGSQIAGGVEAMNGYSDGETVLNQGLLELGGTAADLVVQSGGTVTGGTIVNLIVQTGGTVYGASTIGQALVQAGGTVTGAEIGNVTLAGGYAEFGSLSGTALLGDNATLSFGLLFGGGSLSTAPGTVSFSGSNAELYVNEGCGATDNLNIFRVAGFSSSDTIVLDEINFISESFVSGIGLELNAANLTETIYFDSPISPTDLSVAMGSLGTEITFNDAAPCFCPGTRILTSRGKIPVENLEVGDFVKTATGGFQPIHWIGHRTYDGRFIAGNHLALPVKIRRHALEFNVPSRDLHVSPGHAICEGGVFVHAWRLVNGESITQAARVEQVKYFHVELAEHAVIIAENTPVESFLDNGCRSQFHNAASAPEAPAKQKPCLPLIEEGYYLARLKARIDARAGIAVPRLPGRMRGNIDHVGAVLCGWAQDEAAPEIPVELELLYREQLVRRFLANKFRADLRAAGLGSGCHAFELSLPSFPGTLTVRRVIDGAILGTAHQKAA